MKHSTMALLCTMALGAALAWASSAFAFESYHDPNQNDAGYCVPCHPDFAGGRSDATHALHTGGGAPITTNCDLCHTGSGRDNPLTLWSTYNDDQGFGCTGCHGRDYGETIEADYRGFPIADLPKSSAYGLRRVHAAQGVAICINCHGDMEPLPENVQPPYYADGASGSNVTDPCLDGLDNDGDELYDADDPDCQAPECTVDADCDDGFFCNGTEVCVSGSCQGGTPVDCGDGVSCTVDSCNEATDSCDNTPDDGLCDNGQFCDGNETCDPMDNCQAGNPPQTDDGVDCTIDSCNEATDQIVHTADDAFCNNGLFCDGTETCDPTNDCQAGVDPCPGESCDETADICVACLVDADCDDSLFCNGAEVCVSGSCQGGTPVDCDDGVDCTADSCSEGTDSCDNTPDNTACDNGQFCDGAETCDPVNDCQGPGRNAGGLRRRRRLHGR
jgi:hypothetical protein